VGLLGWLTEVAIAARSGGASKVTGQAVTGGLGLLLLLVLALLPTDLMRQKS
jgi:hypothetical protein